MRPSFLSRSQNCIRNFSEQSSVYRMYRAPTRFFSWINFLNLLFFWIKGLFPILCAIIRRIRLVHVRYSRWFYLSPTRIALKNLKKTLEINYGLSPQRRPTWWIRIFFCHQQLFENSARLIPVGARDIGCGFSPKTRDETQCRWQKKKKRKKKFSYIASVLS